MKKMKFMIGTLVVAGCLTGNTLTADAAMTQNHNIKSNKLKIVQLGKNCDLSSVLSQLQNCFPWICLPQFTQPDVDNSLPDVEMPSPEAPETEFPEQSVPSPEVPEVEFPSPEQPEVNLSYVEQVVRLVNVERAKEGLAPLTINNNVSAAAQVRAKEIVTDFSHTRPDGSSFATALKEQNVSYRQAGENIAWGQKSPQEVVNAWMNSSGHRANIMNKNFMFIGVGHYQHNGTNYWCQLFTS